MPKYTYKCKECDHAFEVVHGMSMKLQNCDACSRNGSLFRVPSITYSMNSDVKKEVEEQKREMMEDHNK